MTPNSIPFKVVVGGGRILDMTIPVEHQVDGMPAFTAEHFQNYVEGIHPELKNTDYKIRF